MRPREWHKSTNSGRDRGSVIVLDLLVTGLVAGVLLLGLAGVLASTFSARSTLDRAAELSDRRTTLERRLADAFVGAVARDVCVERIDPTVSESWANCRRRTSDGRGLLTASASEVCSVVRPDEGLTLAEGTSGLVPLEQVCVSVDPVTGLTVERFEMVGGDRLAPEWSASATAREVVLVDAGTVTVPGTVTQLAPLRYFGVDGVELVPSGSPAVLAEVQRAQVARVRLTIETATLGSTLTTLELEWPVGLGTKEGSDVWLGR